MVLGKGGVKGRGRTGVTGNRQMGSGEKGMFFIVLWHEKTPAPNFDGWPMFCLMTRAT